ncbi:thioredoxin-like protein [Diplocarpon rosae]|nr:thioredoxin-like protein [Diplocarpon rosae]
MYNSTINFTLDTICPSLRRVRESDASSSVTFTIVYHPYQLYPGASHEGEDKYQWYKKSKYGDSEDKMKMYITLMTAYGVSAGINCPSPVGIPRLSCLANPNIDSRLDKFGGTVANTINTHRVIQHFQASSGPVVSDQLINSLYRQYFEEERHPSSTETLLQACKDAGVDEKEAIEIIEDEYKGLQDTRSKIMEQARNGVDSVPYVLIEGKRRDFTVQGANEVEDYVKALQQVVKESS